MLAWFIRHPRPVGVDSAEKSGSGQKKPEDLLHLTEHRGINLRQLKDLLNDIKACADENGYLRGWVDIQGNTCTLDTVNLYDVMKYHVEPKTAARKCSYVELVAPEGTRAQTPKWFVSHWWGEPVKDFIACLEEHARVRNLDPEEAVYWVCAYATKLQLALS